MSNSIIKVSDDFWNIRGSYKIGGLVDVGTQASLVRLASGSFVLLDACDFSASVLRRIREVTDGGNAIEAVLHLHPFHTLHVESAHEHFPDMKLYGTCRHKDKFPELPWQPENTEHPALHELYRDDFEFSVPAGVDFVSSDEKVHFSSVLAYHPASRTIHSDDTFMYLGLPRLMRSMGLGDAVRFHPTLAKVLQPRAGAVEEFRDWAESVIERWSGAENLCAAHTAALLGTENTGASIENRLRLALKRVEGVLEAHSKQWSG